jgi:Flp pilus assembly protein TadD
MFGTSLRRSALAAALVVIVASGLATPASAVILDESPASDTTASYDDAKGLVERGRWKDAIAALRQILDKEPRHADALNLMGYSLRRSGDMAQAEDFYLRALKVRSSHRGANEYLGELYVETGKLDKARERLEALASICGTDCKEYKELKAAIDAAS